MTTRDHTKLEAALKGLPDLSSEPSAGEQYTAANRLAELTGEITESAGVPVEELFSLSAA